MRPLTMENESRPALGRGRYALVIAITAVAGLLTLNSYPVGVLHDDAIYVILAKALATGQGYRYLNIPGAPAATHFPPGYPAFLALLWKVAPAFPLNTLVFKLANVALLVCAAMLMAHLLINQLRFSSTQSALIAIVAACSIPLLLLVALVMSEPLFLVVLLAALVIAERANASPGLRTAIAAGIVAGVAALVRAPGVALLGAIVLAFATRRRIRDAIAAGTAGALVLAPWLIWQRVHRAGIPNELQAAYGTYDGWLANVYASAGIPALAHSVAVTARETVDTLLAQIAFANNAVVRPFAIFALLALLVIGAMQMWKLARTFALFLGLYLLLILVYPVPPARYVWGIWPLLVIVIAVGVREVWRWRPRVPSTTFARNALAGLSAALLVCGAIGTLVGFSQKHWDAIPRQGGDMLRPLVAAARAHTTKDEVIASSAEAGVYLYSDRLSVPVYSYEPQTLGNVTSLSHEAASLASILRLYNVKALIVAGHARNAADMLARDSTKTLTERARSSDVTVFGVSF